MADLKAIRQDEDRLAMVHCPLCNHTWKARPDWRAEVCPKCGHVVQRHGSDMRFD